MVAVDFLVRQAMKIVVAIAQRAEGTPVFVHPCLVQDTTCRHCRRMRDSGSVVPRSDGCGTLVHPLVHPLVPGRWSPEVCWGESTSCRTCLKRGLVEDLLQIRRANNLRNYRESAWVVVVP